MNISLPLSEALCQRFWTKKEERVMADVIEQFHNGEIFQSELWETVQRRIWQECHKQRSIGGIHSHHYRLHGTNSLIGTRGVVRNRAPEALRQIVDKVIRDTGHLIYGDVIPILQSEAEAAGFDIDYIRARNMVQFRRTGRFNMAVM